MLEGFFVFSSKSYDMNCNRSKDLDMHRFLLMRNPLYFNGFHPSNDYKLEKLWFNHKTCGIE